MPLGQGSISLGGTTAGESIALELGLGTSSAISLGDSIVKTLGGFASSSNIDMGTFRGKSNVKDVSSGTGVNVQNLNIYNAAVAAGWDTVSKVTYTIGSGSYIWTDSTSLAALDTGGAFPNGLVIYNGGYIMGKGGNGGPMVGSNSYTVGSPTAGGVAINITANCTIVNNGYIGGGGGGGGSAGTYVKNPNYTTVYYSWWATGGGGAGGGNGGAYSATGFYYGPNGSPGGAGGAIGASGGNGPTYFVSGSYGGTFPWKLGGGGGRIMPGTGGTAVSDSSLTGRGSSGRGGGAGGSGACDLYCNAGGAGGGAGSAGSNGATGNPGAGQATATGGGGGGWGASGGTASRQTSGAVGGGVSAPAAGGKAIARNGFIVTTSGAGTTYGAVG